MKDRQTPTEEQQEEAKAAGREVQFAENFPERSPATLKAFQCSVAQRSSRRKKNGLNPIGIKDVLI